MKLRSLVTFLIVLAVAATAAAQTKLSGTEQCGKPDQMHAIEVGDRPGHLFSISKGKCIWTKPAEIAGAQTKDDETTNFAEVTGTTGRDRGIVVLSMTSGDKAHVRYQGSSTVKDGMPQTGEGKWNFTGGTGKLRGLKGEGTYKGKAGADGSVTYEIEGEYQLPAKK